MSTFTYNLATDIGKVRMYLRDSDEGRAAFTDEEIGVFLTIAGSWRGAVAEAAQVLLMDAARFARVFTDEAGNVTDETAGTELLNGLIDRFGASAATLKKVIVGTLGAHPSDPCTTGTATGCSCGSRCYGGCC